MIESVPELLPFVDISRDDLQATIEAPGSDSMKIKAILLRPVCNLMLIQTPTDNASRDLVLAKVRAEFGDDAERPDTKWDYLEGWQQRACILVFKAPVCCNEAKRDALALALQAGQLDTVRWLINCASPGFYPALKPGDQVSASVRAEADYYFGGWTPSRHGRATNGWPQWGANVRCAALCLNRASPIPPELLAVIVRAWWWMQPSGSR